MERLCKNGTTEHYNISVVKYDGVDYRAVRINGHSVQRLNNKVAEDDFKSTSAKAREVDWANVGWTSPRLTKAIQTVVRRVLDQLPLLAELVPPEKMGAACEQKTAEQKCCHDFYIAVRHILKEQEWCGKQFGIDQLEGIIGIAHNPTVRDPLRFLMKCLSKANLERTLDTLKHHLTTKDERLQNVARRLKIKAQWQLDMWNDIIRGRYNLNDIMIACEIAEGKENPPAYFTAIFRNGKPKWLTEPAEVKGY